MMGSMTVKAVAQSTVLNFVVAGDHRSGVSVVQSALNHTPGVVCHGDLLFDEYGDFEAQEAVRRQAHEDYFGRPVDPVAAVKAPEWFSAKYEFPNPCRYLTDQVFDNPREGEDHVGVRLLYPQLARFDLYDYLEERYREGDFCLVHVLRNPVACLVSLKQAQRSGVWREHASSPVQGRSPLPVSLDPQEAIQAVQQHEAISRKLRAACPDALTVRYRDLVLRYQRTMEGVFEFLELPQQQIPSPAYRRLKNHDMRKRISNYALLRIEAPQVRPYLEEDLF